MKLVVVSNRLPIVIEAQNGSGPEIRPASGGLVTALSPVLRAYGGRWVGWPGCSETEAAALDPLLERHGQRAGFDLAAVHLTDEDLEGFYRGFSNEIIWPLFHDLQTFCNFQPAYWDVYKRVNRKFAEVVAAHANEDDYLWVHDYHLIRLGRELRKRDLRSRLGFFLHTPFPPTEIFNKLPWRREVLESLAAYDLIGFQTPRDCRCFLDSVKHFFATPRIHRVNHLYEFAHNDRRVRTGAFPISIDYAEFAGSAAQPAVARITDSIRRDLPNRHLILGVDRLDYTKGIPDRIRAFGRALERYPDLHRNVTFIQVVVPSRESVSVYQDQKAEIEQLVSVINGQFAQSGWIPIHFFFRSLQRDELLAYYRAADVALVTPLKDGMNLVCKEYCAAQLSENGVLVLSEFAGAAAELHRGALLVNPYDVDGVAESIHQAVVMPPRERRKRMRRLRRWLAEHDIYSWVRSYLSADGQSIVKSSAAFGVAKPPRGPRPPIDAPAPSLLSANSAAGWSGPDD